MKNLKSFLKKLKREDKIEVEWVDHYTSPGWFDPKDITGKPCICYTIGYFADQDETYLYLVSTLSRNQSGTISARIKSQILRMRKLKT